METKTWPIAILLALLSPLAADALAAAAALIADLHIAEIAVAANALTTVF